MNQKNILNNDLPTNTIFARRNIHFRIRSTSKDNFFSVQSKQKQQSNPEPKFFKQQNKNSMTLRFKTSKKELRKIIASQTHKRQRSQNFNQKQFLNTETETIDHKLSQEKKVIYENVKTQQCHLHRKQWIDYNSIDTSQDIKMLDKITTLCDPFRMLHQCNSRQKLQKLQRTRQKLQRKSADYNKLKSLSSKKSSKLAQKINNLVFEINAKSKQTNTTSYKVHKNKFQSFNNISKQKQQQKHAENSENFTARQRPNINSPLVSIRKSQGLLLKLKSTPKNQPQMPSLQNLPKELQISSQLVSNMKKQKFPNNQNIKNVNPFTKANQTQQKTMKIKTKQLLNIKKAKNNVMQKYWSDVNESLILAAQAQQQYVSKDLNQFLYQNMI